MFRTYVVSRHGMVLGYVMYVRVCPGTIWYVMICSGTLRYARVCDAMQWSILLRVIMF